MPRFFVPVPLLSGALLDLPAGAARHVQVLRLQPGAAITLFDGRSDGEFAAEVTRMGRSQVQVQVGAWRPTQTAARCQVHLAVGMPANERMDWLVEKATELGVASLQPLMTERSVLRLSGERAQKKQQHWHSVAVAACEQCGGNLVPLLHSVDTLDNWLSRTSPAADVPRLLMSLLPEAKQIRERAVAVPALCLLVGPEGGLSPGEQASALTSGWTPVSLGSRVLRSETAALAALAAVLV